MLHQRHLGIFQYLSNAQKPYVCKKPKNGKWPEPPTTIAPTGFCKEGYAEFEGYCFKFKTSIKNWNDAKTDCKQEGPGFNLASIHSQRENAFVASLLEADNDNSTNEAWTGGILNGDGVYVWSDMTEFSINHWAPSQPDNPVE